MERRITSQEFEGGEIHVAFGAAEIDLRNAATKREQIFLNLHAAFGGIELLVPDTWVVVLRGSGAFGVFEDKTHAVNPADPSRPRLILTGSAAFGGVTVKN
jgi:predicted membrane protein